MKEKYKYNYKPTKQIWSGGKRRAYAGTGQKYLYIVEQGKKRCAETDIFHARSTAECLLFSRKKPVRIFREIGVMTRSPNKPKKRRRKK